MVPIDEMLLMNARNFPLMEESYISAMRENQFTVIMEPKRAIEEGKEYSRYHKDWNCEEDQGCSKDSPSGVPACLPGNGVPPLSGHSPLRIPNRFLMQGRMEF